MLIFLYCEFLGNNECFLGYNGKFIMYFVHSDSFLLLTIIMLRLTIV